MAVRVSQSRIVLDLFVCSACALILSLTLRAEVRGQDRVRWRAASGEVTERDAEVLELNSKALQLRLPSQRVVNIEASRVLDLQPGDVSGWSEAELARQDGRDQEALRLYREQYQQARRVWVRHLLVARSIECLQNLDQDHAAAKTFLALDQQSQDGVTPFLEQIPLAWRPINLDGTAQRDARQWLSGSSETAQLIAASWLLSTNERVQADAALRMLSESQHDMIARLARMQRWRLSTATIEEPEMRRWQTEINQIPAGLRAGPTFVLAQALERLEDADQAVLAYLEVAFVYNRPRRLAAESLYLAARLSRQQGRLDEARRFSDELVRRFPSSTWTEANRNER